MEKSMLNPNEIVKSTINAGINKTKLTSFQMILLGIFAGVFIGFGAHGNIVTTQMLGSFDVGIAKLIGAAVFPIGLMLVVIAGAELFTGNNLMTLALFAKKITLPELLKNWVLVYIGNFLGSVLLGYIIVKSGLYTPDSGITSKAIGLSEAKVNIAFQEAILRGILCNIIVVLAVWLSSASHNVIGKIFAIWFPIMLFVLSGFEHSVANMFFIPLGKFLGANITWSEIWINNLIPVTLGNIIGGAIIIPGVYYLIYVYKK